MDACGVRGRTRPQRTAKSCGPSAADFEVPPEFAAIPFWELQNRKRHWNRTIAVALGFPKFVKVGSRIAHELRKAGNRHLDADAKLVTVLCIAARDGDNKPDHQGEHEGHRKTAARGMPGCPGEPVVTNSCAFSFAHEAAGAPGTRHSPRPPCLESDVWQYPGSVGFAGTRRRASLRLHPSRRIAPAMLLRMRFRTEGLNPSW